MRPTVIQTMLQKITCTLSPHALKVSVEPGTTPFELFKKYREKLSDTYFGNPITVLVNNHEQSMNIPLLNDCTLEYVDVRSNLGHRAYTRTLILILSKATSDLGFEVRIEHAISHGYYGVIKGHSPLSKEVVERLKDRMLEIIKSDLLINRNLIPNAVAVDYFRGHNRNETADLIESNGQFYVTLTEIEGGFMDHIFGTTAPHTGATPLFELESYFDGFLLRTPDQYNPEKLASWIPQPKLFGVFRNHLRLIEMLGVEDVEPLNKAIRGGKATDLINIAEAAQERHIAEIAADITRRHESEGLRVVLLSGPSSSGKTTTSKRLRTQLLTNLLTPHVISLDDFYVNRIDTPLDDKGALDYESLYAIDLPYLNDVMTKLTRGETVQLPTYNFKTGKREMKPDKLLTLGEHDLLIFEGIHGLNPELLNGIDRNKVYKVYVSALTTLSLDHHNPLSTSDNRLLRRIVRDLKYRNTTAEENILRWNSVRHGEETWIFPFQEEADAIFNSAMMYEFAALRPQAEAALGRVPEVSPAYPTAERLLNLLRLFEPIELRHMPPSSLLREFLGGSIFQD